MYILEGNVYVNVQKKSHRDWEIIKNQIMYKKVR